LWNIVDNVEHNDILAIINMRLMVVVGCNYSFLSMWVVVAEDVVDGGGELPWARRRGSRQEGMLRWFAGGLAMGSSRPPVAHVVAHASAYHVSERAPELVPLLTSDVPLSAHARAFTVSAAAHSRPL
jgi:hypothetical protein